MRTVLLFLVVINLSIACKSEKDNQVTNQPTVSPPTQSMTLPILPAAPEDLIFQMYEEVDHIDYMFRNTNFSISQDEKEAVQGVISTLSPSPARSVGDHCKSPIRMTYLAAGEILVETEMYMTDGCQYVEYYIDNKKTYQNNYSQEGYNYLLTLINQAKNVNQQ